MEQRRRKEKEFQERMVSGKRKKYTLEERKMYMQEAMKKRNDLEDKVLSAEITVSYPV